MKLHKAAHTGYKTQYHIVWVTRYRRKILVEGVAKYLRSKLQEVRKYYLDWPFTEIGIDKDLMYVHMVIPKKYSVSFAMETIKKNARRALWDMIGKIAGGKAWTTWKRGCHIEPVAKLPRNDSRPLWCGYALANELCRNAGEERESTVGGPDARPRAAGAESLSR